MPVFDLAHFGGMYVCKCMCYFVFAMKDSKARIPFSDLAHCGGMYVCMSMHACINACMYSCMFEMIDSKARTCPFLTWRILEVCMYCIRMHVLIYV